MPPQNSAAPPLRLGVIGCGAVTERYHLPALLASSDIRVTAFADPALDRARALAERAGGGSAVADHRELIGTVDAALVAVPNAWHEPIASDLLRAGIHVLVEKPMARTAVECDRMIAAAASAGAVLAIGHDFRHFPVARFARDFFVAGALGRIRRVDLRQSAGGRWPYASTAVLSPAAGGGVLLDFGVHLYDLLLWWLGEIEPVSYRDDAEGGVESECECELRLADGAPVHVELSRSRTLRDTVVVEGERGRVEIGVFEPAVVRLSLPGGAELAGAAPDPEFDRAPLRAVFGRQLADFVGAIRQRRAPLVSGPDARRAVALVEGCYARKQPLRWPWSWPEAYAAVAGAGA
jgi:predicted dehydrogenase